MKKRNRNNGNASGDLRKRLIIISAISAVLLIVIGILAADYALKRYDGGQRWIYVPAGTTKEQLHAQLKAKLGESDGNRVYRLWRFQNGDIATAHGAYRVSSGERDLLIARRLAQGRQTPVEAQWTDARTMEILAERITAPLECSSGEFIEACNILLPEAGFSEEEFPAAFIPAKFEFYWTDPAEKIVKKLLEYRNQYWDTDRRAKADALGLTPIEVATLASIVGEETNKSDEWGKVARLYLNRLNRGMMLQADPTVKFALNNPSIKRILKEHLKTPSPYNTYRHKGLPPGPIRITDKQTLDAVLNAPRHDYLFMCAKADFSGYHDFAESYSEHQANARRYQAELNRRGIK